MIVSNIILSNFRNFSKYKIDFSPNITVIIGPNASGKTNIVESIFMLATGRSFRDISDREAISFGKEITRINGKILESNNKLEIMITNGEVMKIKTPFKKYTVNGVGKRMIDFIGNLKAVLFWPQDMELVTHTPSYRRKYLDFVLMQVDREYRRTLISYERAIRQRNKILEAIRDTGAHRHQLLFWDQLLIKAGEYVTKKREEYITFINNYQIPITPATGGIPLRRDNFQISNYQIFYDKSVISRDRLDQYTEEEIAAATTLVGPQRDDIIFKIKDQKSEIRDNNEYRNLAHFGSRGEQRLAVLWLKLAELSYIEKVTGEKPVLLLDDIFSELDHEHRDIIFDVIENQQTVMTATDEHFISKEKVKNGKIFMLKNL